MKKHKHNLERRKIIKVITASSLSLISGFLPNPVTAKTKMLARIFYDSYGTIALRHALRYAGDNGYIASMPQLLNARLDANYQNIIWNTFFTANSEEYILKTPQNNHVVLTLHGAGIFNNPKAIENTLRANLDRHNNKGLTGQYAAKITNQQGKDLLNGYLPNKKEFQIFNFSEFKAGISKLPQIYGVLLDLKTARKTESGYQPFSTLIKNPVMIVRTGGSELLEQYLTKFQLRNNTERMGNFHNYNSINPDQPQAKILRLGGAKGGKYSDGDSSEFGRGWDRDWGLSSGFYPSLARYVAIAPKNLEKELHHLDFEV